jgi:gliding motility-associated-like protein
MSKTSFIIISILYLFVGKLTAQINISNSAPYDDKNFLVNSILSGGGVSATNITFTAANSNQIGFFKNGNSGIGNINLDSGIVISTGNVHHITPDGNLTGEPNSSYFQGVGDLDLLSLAKQVTNNPTAPTITSTYDAASLEFDFEVTGDTIEFQFVFASEEYLEYVNTPYNDIFAFFISGPGINGPWGSPINFPNGAINLATIPGSNTPITVSSIHPAGTNFYGPFPSLNDQYYQSNTSESSHKFNGFTTVITVKYPVKCGGTYHFKFAIADCEDGTLDSGVFVKSGSLTSNGISITSNTNTLTEGCNDALITIKRSDLSFNDTINLEFDGNAIPSEYSNIPAQLIFPNGATEITINLSAFIDHITEGIDTLIIRLAGYNGCNELTLYIEDYTIMSLKESDSLNICNELDEFALLWVKVTNGKPPYSYYWNNGAGSENTVTVRPEETTFYTPTVTDFCGKSVTGEIIPVFVQCKILKTNIFTPNGDGINDVFKLFNLDDYPTPGIKIYNRWGRLVYESDVYKNDWDGGNLKTGTYYYILTPNSKKFVYDADAKENLKQVVKGYVNLMR